MGEIKHIHNNSKGAFTYTEDGKRLAEMAYVMAGGEKMIIEHTGVDESLKGQGVGKKLQAALVDHVRENGIKVVPLCPFAKAMFERNTDWQDVLA
ncbi:GNAT family N-acetyltransferase [Sinomicrobium soli]|uniref:GNAT family N-acetyltransferase n=1 Tax=Sinomicrobium sp. N-1-3-6 TaxID=2219864 RepID=UPI000DCE142A|nr:GNAT family N-acetyltransferase [Sinomicrobium sp. N-1-3-6]RAV27760.1 N-acetyltransferase [Sinomicrobium sp. N-1-3-6]